MVKKQQMRQAPKSAHLLLPVRAKVLNDKLALSSDGTRPLTLPPTQP